MAYADIQKRIRRRKLRFRIFLSLILISAVAIYLFRNPVIKVNNLFVKGNNIVPAEKLIELSGVKTGDNLLRLNYKKINDSLKTNSYIEESRVKITLAGNVSLIVNERQASGIAAFGSKYVTMDKKGVIIEILDSTEGINLPLVSGLEITDAVPGKTVELTDARKINAMKIIFNYVTNNDLSGIINEVDLKSLLSISVKTKDNINFKLGDIENIESKLDRCVVIMNQDLKKKGSKGTIDVSFKGNPVFVPVQ